MTGGPVVVDTSALMAVLFAEVDALVYAQALESATRLRMAAPTWVESMQVITARRGDLGQAGLAELLSRLAVEIVPCDADLARLTYEAWRHFGKGRHPAGLNFGDCFSYALAKQRGEPLLFKGWGFLPHGPVRCLGGQGRFGLNRVQNGTRIFSGTNAGQGNRP